MDIVISHRKILKRKESTVAITPKSSQIEVQHLNSLGKVGLSYSKYDASISNVSYMTSLYYVTREKPPATTLKGLNSLTGNEVRIASITYKEFLQINRKVVLNKKKAMNLHFREEIQKANKQIKRCLTVPVIREHR